MENGRRWKELARSVGKNVGREKREIKHPDRVYFNSRANGKFIAAQVVTRYAPPPNVVQNCFKFKSTLINKLLIRKNNDKYKGNAIKKRDYTSVNSVEL